MTLRVAHIVVVTPHQAGIYETTRDLAAAERRAGVDARIIDPIKEIVTVDRGVPVVAPAFAKTAHVIVNHSGLSKDLDKTQLPIIHMLHGRPLSSFLLGQSGQIPIYTYLARIRHDPRFKLFVTFWSEFLPYWAMLLPSDKLRAIPAPVDLNLWSPDGPSHYDFHGHSGTTNIVCADMWRNDITPYHPIHAFTLFASRVPGARLHIYGAPQKGTAWQTLKAALSERDILGEVPNGIVRGLANVYRAASAVITPHRIATRSVREPLACGCNVVMAPGNPYTPFQADPQDLEAYAAQIQHAVSHTAQNRKAAELYFDSNSTAKQFIALLHEVTNGNR